MDWKDPERVREYYRNYYCANIEKCRACSRKSYNINKKNRLETTKIYRIQNAEKIKKQRKSYYPKYYKDNADLIRKINKKYRELNSNKIKEYANKYRKTNKQEIRIKARKQREKNRDKLSRKYLKTIIQAQTGLKFCEITEEMVILKREQVKLYRELKKGKEILKDGTIRGRNQGNSANDPAV